MTATFAPRLHGFIAEQRRAHDDWHNGPVDTFLPLKGPASVRLLIVGLAPGLPRCQQDRSPRLPAILPETFFMEP